MVDAPDGTPDESDGVIRDLKRQIAELRSENKELRMQDDPAFTYAFKLRAEAAEAENARLRALPLKDEVERVLERTSKTVKRYRRAGLGDDVFHSDLCETDAAIDALLSRLRAGEQEVWRTMNSAPVGVDILVGGDLGHGWKSHVYQIRDEFWREDWEDEPTHWMPLPAAPSEQGGGCG